MSTATNPSPSPRNRAERRQKEQHNHHSHGGPPRSVADLRLPASWQVEVRELGLGTQGGGRSRARLLVLRTPKGVKVLLFLTVRLDSGGELDVLPANVAETALPVSAFGRDGVLEDLPEVLADLGKEQQASLHAPLSQRPLEKLRHLHLVAEAPAAAPAPRRRKRSLLLRVAHLL